MAPILKGFRDLLCKWPTQKTLNLIVSIVKHLLNPHSIPIENLLIFITFLIWLCPFSIIYWTNPHNWNFIEVASTRKCTMETVGNVPEFFNLLSLTPCLTLLLDTSKNDLLRKFVNTIFGNFPNICFTQAYLALLWPLWIWLQVSMLTQT